MITEYNENDTSHEENLRFFYKLVFGEEPEMNQ